MIKYLLIFMLLISPIHADEREVTEQRYDLARIAEQIRSGKIDVGEEYSIKDKTGRFHRIHADKMLLDCTTCHYGYRYRGDYQIVGKDKPFPDKAKGQYQRSVCLGCHQSGGIATRWYNSSTQK